MIRKILSAAFFAVFVVHNSFAEEYFSADKIPLNSIAKPLDRNHQEYRSEVNKIILLQKNADPKEVEESNNEIALKAENISVFVDQSLTRSDLPKLYILLDNSLQTTIKVTEKFKNHWNMKRPYLSDSRIKSLVKTPATNPSYPSGHTTTSFVTAEILASLIPSKSNQFLQRADEVANHRILVGMHFPHDIEAGKVLAKIILKNLHQSDEFKKDYAAAAAELSAKSIN